MKIWQKICGKRALRASAMKSFSASTPVVMVRIIRKFWLIKRLAEQVTGRKIVFEQIGGATDARLFAEKGATVIMHSGTGEGMHADGEYVVWQSVEELARIQIEYLKSLANA